MAGAGKKTFTAGETLTASDVNTYLMEQSVMVFGGTAARSSAIPTPSEGMTSYRTDTQQIESYDGAEWRGMSGLQLVKKQTVGSAVSSVTVTGAFSATYENYKIFYTGGTASGSGEFNLSLDGITTGYTTSIIYAPGATALAAIQSNVSSWFWAGGTNSNSAESTIEITNPFASKQKSFSSGLKFASFGTSTGFCNSTSSATAFTMTPSVGTITGGTIYVYGYGV